MEFIPLAKTKISGRWNSSFSLVVMRFLTRITLPIKGWLIYPSLGDFDNAGSAPRWSRKFPESLKPQIRAKSPNHTAAAHLRRLRGVSARWRFLVSRDAADLGFQAVDRVTRGNVHRA